MKKKARVATLCAASLALALGAYVFWPLSNEPTPADFTCYDLDSGEHVPLEGPGQAFGLGLSYAAHIRETASSYDPDVAPPVFGKRVSAMVHGGADVPLPSPAQLIEAAERVESGLGAELRERHPDLPPLLDYEVELGFVLLEDVAPSALDDTSFAPRLGFFVVNDLSARSLAILGEGRANRYTYWGESKSFAGFMPITERAWVPKQHAPNGIPCVEIETVVGDELRQRQSTRDLVYTPRQMLLHIRAAFPEASLEKGTVVLTGTPGGVAMSTPRWLVRLADLVGVDRFRKLSVKLDGDTSQYLKAGDRVTVRGAPLGEVTVTIEPPESSDGR